MVAFSVADAGTSGSGCPTSVSSPVSVGPRHRCNGSVASVPAITWIPFADAGIDHAVARSRIHPGSGGTVNGSSVRVARDAMPFGAAPSTPPERLAGAGIRASVSHGAIRSRVPDTRLA
jgi:hypothetical protein